MIKSIQDKSRNTYSGKQTSYGEVIAGNQQSSAADFGVFGKGRTIKLDEAYDFYPMGTSVLQSLKVICQEGIMKIITEEVKLLGIRLLMA